MTRLDYKLGQKPKSKLIAEINTTKPDHSDIEIRVQPGIGGWYNESSRSGSDRIKTRPCRQMLQFRDLLNVSGQSRRQTDITNTKLQ